MKSGSRQTSLEVGKCVVGTSTGLMVVDGATPTAATVRTGSQLRCRTTRSLLSRGSTLTTQWSQPPIALGPLSTLQTGDCRRARLYLRSFGPRRWHRCWANRLPLPIYVSSIARLGTGVDRDGVSQPRLSRSLHSVVCGARMEHEALWPLLLDIRHAVKADFPGTLCFDHMGELFFALCHGTDQCGEAMTD